MFTRTDISGGGRVAPVAAHAARAADAFGQADGGPRPAPCAARPSTDFVHPEGRCRCFAGGPAPEFAPARVLGVARAS